MASLESTAAFLDTALLFPFALLAGLWAFILWRALQRLCSRREPALVPRPSVCVARSPPASVSVLLGEHALFLVLVPVAMAGLWLLSRALRCLPGGREPASTPRSPARSPVRSPRSPRRSVPLPDPPAVQDTGFGAPIDLVIPRRWAWERTFAERQAADKAFFEHEAEKRRNDDRVFELRRAGRTEMRQPKKKAVRFAAPPPPPPLVAVAPVPSKPAREPFDLVAWQARVDAFSEAIKMPTFSLLPDPRVLLAPLPPSAPPAPSAPLFPPLRPASPPPSAPKRAAVAIEPPPPPPPAAALAIEPEKPQQSSAPVVLPPQPSSAPKRAAVADAPPQPPPTADGMAIEPETPQQPSAPAAIPSQRPKATTRAPRAIAPPAPPAAAAAPPPGPIFDMSAIARLTAPAPAPTNLTPAQKSHRDVVLGLINLVEKVQAESNATTGTRDEQRLIGWMICLDKPEFAPELMRLVADLGKIKAAISNGRGQLNEAVMPRALLEPCLLAGPKWTGMMDGILHGKDALLEYIDYGPGKARDSEWGPHWARLETAWKKCEELYDFVSTQAVGL